jgi:uncharacterized membrane protein
MTLPLAVTSYDFSLFLHITAVVSPRHLPYVHRLQLAINQYFATPALVVVLATGFYQVSERDWQLGDFWLSGTLAIVIVIGGLLGAYFIPADRRLGPMVQRDIDNFGPGEISLSDLSPEYQRQGRMEGVVGTIVGVLLIAAIYLMVTKPGA